MILIKIFIVNYDRSRLENHRKNKPHQSVDRKKSLNKRRFSYKESCSSNLGETEHLN